MIRYKFPPWKLSPLFFHPPTTPLLTTLKMRSAFVATALAALATSMVAAAPLAKRADAAAAKPDIDVVILNCELR